MMPGISSTTAAQITAGRLQVSDANAPGSQRAETYTPLGRAIVGVRQGGCTASSSQAHIGTQPYQIGPDTPPIVREFLQNTLSNNRYDSLEHLQSRAENYLRHRAAEANILHATTEGLGKPESAVFKQAAWMGHLERGLWHTEHRFGGNDREQLGKEALGVSEPLPGSPFHGVRGLNLSDTARSAFSMMLRGGAGPFTQEQARAGFELAQTGQVLAGRLEISERMKFRQDNRVDAQRNGTHSTRTQGGMDLSQDMGTTMCDKAGLPVMSGTSGSSSDAAIATRFAAGRSSTSWHAPDLSEAEGRKAIADLSHGLSTLTVSYGKDDQVRRTAVQRGTLAVQDLQAGGGIAGPLNRDARHMASVADERAIAGSKLTMEVGDLLEHLKNRLKSKSEAGDARAAIARRGEDRYQHRVIVQQGEDAVTAQAAKNLAGKHPDNTVLVKADQQGNLIGLEQVPAGRGNVKMQVVGHGDVESGKLGGADAPTVARQIEQVKARLGEEAQVGKVALVGCQTACAPEAGQPSLTTRVQTELAKQGTGVGELTGRNTYVKVDREGHKQDATVDDLDALGKSKGGRPVKISEEIVDQVIKNSKNERYLELAEMRNKDSNASNLWWWNKDLVDYVATRFSNNDAIDEKNLPRLKNADDTRAQVNLLLSSGVGNIREDILATNEYSYKATCAGRSLATALGDHAGGISFVVPMAIAAECAKAGNCGERAACAAVHHTERLSPGETIQYVSGVDVDHAFVRLRKPGCEDILVDAWQAGPAVEARDSPWGEIPTLTYTVIGNHNAMDVYGEYNSVYKFAMKNYHLIMGLFNNALWAIDENEVTGMYDRSNILNGSEIYNFDRSARVKGRLIASKVVSLNKIIGNDLKMEVNKVGAARGLVGNGRIKDAISYVNEK
ncbi:C80 family cysteine peptidase [Burkholderia ubonensis]|uniref:C80 family cysteine peptidase n=1 Tax=Burkholderia ubonensis TaxID=101571 RepID=UPI0012F8DC4E|nr:C80 family cysteine peptidase [Burkholderia ubonensis]